MKDILSPTADPYKKTAFWGLSIIGGTILTVLTLQAPNIIAGPIVDNHNRDKEAHSGEHMKQTKRLAEIEETIAVIQATQEQNTQNAADIKQDIRLILGELRETQRLLLDLK